MHCKAHAPLDAHRSSWVAGAARRWCGVHWQDGKVLVLAERSAASAQRCWQHCVVARASFPELATRQTLARRALSARGAQRNFCRCELALHSQRVVSAMQIYETCIALTTRGECNASLLGHRPRSCALCWHSVRAAGECSPEISRLVHTEGKGRTSGCLILAQNRHTAGMGLDPTSAQ